MNPVRPFRFNGAKTGRSNGVKEKIKKFIDILIRVFNYLLAFFSNAMGIDLGTATTLV